jgi:hypothetical protein
MEAAIARSNSAKSRSSRFGGFEHARHRSEELGVVHETILENPELALTESRTWNPNKESNAIVGSASPDQPVEKKQKRRISIGFFPSIKRNSGSIRSSSKSTTSDSSMRNAIASDFSIKPLDGGKSRSSALPVSLVLSAPILQFLIRPLPSAPPRRPMRIRSSRLRSRKPPISQRSRGPNR